MKVEGCTQERNYVIVTLCTALWASPSRSDPSAAAALRRVSLCRRQVLQLPADFRRHSSAACCTRDCRDPVLPGPGRTRSPSVSAMGLAFRRRSFSVTPQGGLVNEGDVVVPAASPEDAGSRRSSYQSGAETGSGGADSTTTEGSSPVYRVLMIGGPGVGKTALTQQFMTSEFMAAQNTSFGQSTSSFCRLHCKSFVP